MDLLFLGLSHHTADVDVRARVAAAVSDVPRWLGAVTGAGAVAELLVLSTCHRLECYAATSDVAAARAELASRVGADLGARQDGGPVWVTRTGADAAWHLCRVAAGLDSLIVGEAEIAGQVRRAANVAREAGALGPYLERVVAGALAASGRARSETRIGEGVFSASSAGVAVAAKALGSLAGRHVLVIGAGQAGRSVLARLERKAVATVTVASRSSRHAHDAAEASGASVCALEDVPTCVAGVDAVIAAMPSDHWLITADTVRAAQAASPGRVRVFVDLSMPCIIEPAVAALGDVELFTVDDLGDIARRSLRRREREVPIVEAIARDEAARAYTRVQARRRFDAGVSRRP